LGQAEIEAAIEVDVGFRPPHGLAQLFTGNDLAATREEAGEHLSWLGLRANEAAFATQFTGGGVEFEKAKTEAVHS
jgi:hypothetical protein